MKEQDQRIVLCEWMGWKYHKPTPEEIATGSYYQYEPNTNSLDVLHEMEKKLTDEQHKEFRRILRYLVTDVPHTDAERAAYSASAPQRREALLRTLNLWKE